MKQNLENPFRVFITLKHLYPEGKSKLTKEEINYISIVLKLNPKTIKANLKRLINLNWIHKNNKTQYYIFHSIDSIRLQNEWYSRASIEIESVDTYNIRAILGAALYGYLHKDFWRKVKKSKRKGVRIKQRTYHFPHPSFNFKIESAPISVNGVNAIFNIPIAKASRIKSLAQAYNYIEVTKTFRELHITKFDLMGLKEFDLVATNNIIFKDNKYYLQEIDHIVPLFNIRKRKKLET